jgi:hypothetical protein
LYWNSQAATVYGGVVQIWLRKTLSSLILRIGDAGQGTGASVNRFR